MFFKRFIDILVSSSALILLSPILLSLIIIIRIKLGSPVFFSQKRPGKNGIIFKMYKFRSMTDERDQNSNLLPDHERLPEFGQKLRATSLDELPELWNILKGDMSLIGPRPLLPSYLSLYNAFQKRRHEVKPGLTGWAQVNGRNNLDWPERFKLDVEYVDNISLLIDIKIIIQTIEKVKKKEGISSEKSMTMEPFKGNDVNE
ncbi:sugar transferase [Aerococcus urinaeequi]|uniref:Sugar transferase n=1 Tax=Aerococcus urinaeequi TaxID=51665 RepID=A0A7M1KV61_9LACT|nr:sugar transferase [Aerococcus urinaeequi]